MTMQTMPLPVTSVLVRLASRAGAVALRLVELVRAYKNRRDIQSLAAFDDRMLRDIGLTRGDIRDAVSEPLWRDPTSILVLRARERRSAARNLRIFDGLASLPANGQDAPANDAPPLAPRLDDWSSRQFPARSRYY